MTPSQCRTARNLLDWSVADLARAAGVSVITVRKFEAAKMAPAARTSATLMRRALEGAGIRFSRSDNGDGVRLGPRAP